jgi:hypothetical protein
MNRSVYIYNPIDIPASSVSKLWILLTLLLVGTGNNFVGSAINNESLDLVKDWDGERIHLECASDKPWSSNTRVDPS